MSKKPTNKQIDALGVDPTAAAVKSSVSRKQWRRLVKRAHKNGVTVSGFLSGNPRALQERTRSSLRSEAETTIRRAYAPAVAELSDREKRVKAVDEKRSADNKTYLNWLQTQSTKLRADSEYADQQLGDHQRQIQQDTSAAYQAMHGIAADALGQMQGTVSDFGGQAKALDFSAAGQRANDMIANERTHTAQMIDSNTKLQAASEANNFALIAASEAKRTGDTWQQLADVASDRDKLRLQQAADSAKEVSRLLDREIDKANSNRDFNIVANKLDLSAQELAFNKKKFGQTFGLDQKKFQHQVNQDALQLDLDRDKLNQDASQFDAELDVKWYKARHPSTGSGSGSGGRKIGDTNQHAFDAAVASIGAKMRYGRKNKPISRNYARSHRNQLVSALVANLGVNRKVAAAAATAYAYGGRSDPGDFHRWVRASKHKAQTKEPGGRPPRG